jgi:probable rRNA maturation factor
LTAARPCKLALSLRCEASAWKPLVVQRKLIRAAIAAAMAAPPLRPLDRAEVSILLTGDTQMREINKAWRGLDKPTNVLSFPACPPKNIAQSPVLGDIVIAYETLAREAIEENKSFSDHLAHLVIHGLYHLLGDDHETEEEATRMEARETAALARLGIAGPYQEPALPILPLLTPLTG